MISFLKKAALSYSFPILLSGGLWGTAVCEEASVLDIFPPSGVTSTADKTTCSFKYEPSGSTWTKGVDEEKVFLASFAGDGWRLGVGKGGHIYSLRGAYGESVAPQRVNSPWNDEVWQAVITSEVLATPIHEYHAENPGVWGDLFPLLYFVHQAGIYVKGAGNDGGAPTPFYSPCLGKRWNPKTKTLQLVNWMQQANSPCVWRSGVLIYTAFRDLGDGVIEVNQVLHNFGSVPLDYVSAPWGGVRKSSLPHTVISKADGSWGVETGLWNWDGVPQRKLPKSGGWAAWVKNPKDDASPSLSMVFGKKNVAGTEDRVADFVKVKGRVESERLILWGTAGENSPRDYEATEQVAKLAVREGESYSIRWYLVSGGFGHIRKVSPTLSEKAGIKAITFDPKAVQSLWVDNGEVSLTKKGKRWGGFLAFPAKDCVPVFLLKDKKTGEKVITADIYALAPTKPFPNPLPKDHKEYERYQDRFYYQQYLPHIGYENLLGYAWKKKPEDSRSRKISVPDGVNLHDSAKDLWMIK